MPELIHGDCLDKEIGLPSLAPETFDACVTSPPYNLGIKYHQYNDNKTREQYLNWLGSVFSEVYRTLKPSGHLFLNVGYSNRDPWIAQDVAGVLRKQWTLQNSIIWVKSLHVNSKTFGHFKPINSNRYITPTWEHLYHFTKSELTTVDKLAVGVPYVYYEGNKRNPKTADTKPNLRCRGNTWFVPYDTIQSKYEKGKHPAIFPVALADMCLRLTGITSGCVLDPFMGTGTTAVAAEANHWDYTGFDIDVEYMEFAQERLALWT